MKTLKNSSVQVYKYTNEKFDQYLELENSRIINEVIIPQARELGETNKPSPEVINGRPYIGKISSEYQDLIMVSKKANQAEIEYLNKTESDKLSIKKEAELLNEIEENNNRIRIKKGEIARFDQALIEKDKKWDKIKWLLYLGGGADIIICCSIFEIMGLGYFSSLGLALIIGVCLLLCSEFAPKYIRKGRTRMQRLLIAACISLGVIGLFYTLAVFRIIQLSENISLFREGLSPIIFVAINFFVFAVITAVCYIMKPTEEEQKILNEINLKQKELKGFEQKGNELKKEKENVESQNLANKIISAQLLLYAQNCELRILSLYRAAYETFISTNLIYRRDHLIPIFFNDGPPPIQTFYQKGDEVMNN